MSTSSAGSLSSPGIGSGLNVTSLVSQLMATQQQPLVNLQVKQATYQAEISAYGSLQGTLSTLQNDVTNLSSAALYSAFTTNASASGFFSSSADSTASAGSYSLSVTNLAQANKLATGDYASTTTAVGTGTLTFQYGTDNSGTFSVNAAQPTQTVTIDAAHSSLAGISAAINAANIGVSASISYDGTGYRLVLSSNNSGAANALKVSTTGSLSALTYDPNTAGVKNLTQTVAANDATFTLDGMAMTSASNTVTSAIQGISLTLTQPTTAPVTLTVAPDTSGILSSVQAFVTDYNATQASIKSLTAYNATTKSASVLTGDSTVLGVQSQLRAILNTPLTTAGGGLSNLADVGVTFQKDGTLALNTAKLNAVLADPTKNISTLFASVGVPTDPLVKFATSTAATQGGNYAVNITQAATQGTLSGTSTPGLTGLTVTSSTNDQFNLNVNGIAAAITLPAGTYTPTTLAAQVQSQINGASALSAAGITVSVGYNGTQGNAVGSAAAGLTITSGVNDGLSLTVDGQAISVTVAAGNTYTASTLAAQVQTKINAALTGGRSVVVSASNGGVLSITSDSYGATSNVGSISGNGGANLLGTPTSTAGTGTGTMLIKTTQYGSASSITASAVGGNTGLSDLLGAPVSTAGVDVAGTIGGLAAKGIGQALTGTAGNATGLTLTVAGTTTGARGTVAYASGIASQLATALANMTSATGLIADRTTSLQTSISNIGTQTNQVNARLAAIQAQYLQQFTALDTMMASMTQTSTFLTQQITSLQNNPIVIK